MFLFKYVGLEMTVKHCHGDVLEVIGDEAVNSGREK